MTTRVLFVVITLGAMLALSGCAGTYVSSRPIYPADWPAMEAGQACPNLAGKYLAISDEAAPLVYPPGGAPRNMAFFVSYGEPVPAPALGRRILTWHLAGARKEADAEVWNDLSHYAETIEKDATQSSTKQGDGWVLVQQGADDRIEVRAGLRDRVLLAFELRKGSAGFLFPDNHFYQCKDGVLHIGGSFPEPLVEDPNGPLTTPAYASFTFYRAVDGSLVMLEDPFAGSNTLSFQKWWRWRPIEWTHRGG